MIWVGQSERMSRVRRASNEIDVDGIDITGCGTVGCADRTSLGYLVAELFGKRVADMAKRFV